MEYSNQRKYKVKQKADDKDKNQRDDKGNKKKPQPEGLPYSKRAGNYNKEQDKKEYSNVEPKDSFKSKSKRCPTCGK